MIVVDTNVVSELMKAAPDDSVRNWLLSQNQADVFTTAVTVAEVLYGIERLPQEQRRAQLASAARQIFADFGDHVLAFDHQAAGVYAEIVHARDERGLPINGLDAQIAAVCAVHDAALATRNVKDFALTGIRVIDPWQGMDHGGRTDGETGDVVR